MPPAAAADVKMADAKIAPPPAHPVPPAAVADAEMADAKIAPPQAHPALSAPAAVPKADAHVPPLAAAAPKADAHVPPLAAAAPAVGANAVAGADGAAAVVGVAGAVVPPAPAVVAGVNDAAAGVAAAVAAIGAAGAASEWTATLHLLYEGVNAMVTMKADLKKASEDAKAAEALAARKRAESLACDSMASAAESRRSCLAGRVVELRGLVCDRARALGVVLPADLLSA